MTAMEKLRILLPHWIEHNHDHSEEFAKWAAIAGQEGEREIADLIGQAISSLQEAGQVMAQALEIAGGSTAGEGHHHK